MQKKRDTCALADLGTDVAPGGRCQCWQWAAPVFFCLTPHRLPHPAVHPRCNSHSAHLAFFCWRQRRPPDPVHHSQLDHDPTCSAGPMLRQTEHLSGHGLTVRAAERVTCLQLRVVSCNAEARLCDCSLVCELEHTIWKAKAAAEPEDADGCFQLCCRYRCLWHQWRLVLDALLA